MFGAWPGTTLVLLAAVASGVGVRLGRGVERSLGSTPR
jgi:hypothetical protein